MQGGHGTFCRCPPPRFFEKGAKWGIMHVCEEMYLDLSITSDDNAMLSGSDGRNYQSGGVGLGDAPIV